MARDFVLINNVSGAKFAGELIAYIASVRNCLERGARMKEIMEHMVAGTPPTDFIDVEAHFGVPVGKGGDVYNLVLGTEAAVRSVDSRLLVAKVG